MPRAVILTALSVEYLAVRAHLSDLREEVHSQGTVYERGQFLAEGQSWEVGIVEVGAGNPGAAVEAERAIGYFSPDVIFFVGVAGGIKNVTIGDVVAATEVYSYEFGKAGETFQTRPKSRDADYGLEQRARAEARKGDWLQRLAKVPDPAPKVFVGPIAAGEKVIASRQSAVFQLLRSHYEDALAVEMEGFGFLSAVRGHKQVDAIVIRGISDLIDEKAKADRGGSQEIAACHASAFAFQMLSKLGKKSALGERVLPNEATMAQNSTDNAKSIGKPDIPPISSTPMAPPKSAQEMNLDSVSPKVFVSYSHDSQEHKDQVLALAERLRQDGIDCTIDQNEKSPAEGWQRWMLNQVKEATFVLVVCTETYDRRFRGSEKPGRGKGATWEGDMIIQELYDAQGQNPKFIPIILSSEDANFIPSPLRSTTSYRLNTTDGYEQLYRSLTNQHDTPRLELGKIRALAPRDRKQVFESLPNASEQLGKIEVFFSYSHEDESLRDKLATHLSGLRREGIIKEWHDRKIGAGREWAGEIDRNLEAAQLILLLISADFIDSDYCMDKEVKRALERHKSNTARVVPVILRPVDWEYLPFGKLQALPKNGNPVTSWPDQDQALTNVAKGIRNIIEEINEDHQSR
jgi:nucleoside phosphorylase